MDRGVRRTIPLRPWGVPGFPDRWPARRDIAAVGIEARTVVARMWS